MRVQVGDVRLFFDVHGTKLVADGPWMRERATVVLLHPGPGFDHGLFKIGIGPWLSSGAQVVYLDMRGAGRSDYGEPADLRLERWADDVREFCDVLRIEKPIVFGLGFGSMVALDYAARHPKHPGALVLGAPIARVVPERSIPVYERLGGPEAGEAATRYYGDHTDEQAFADFIRVCFPLLSLYPFTSDVIVRANWRPEVLVDWMRGESHTIDLRDRIGAIQAPAIVIAGEDDAWAPLDSAREVAELLHDRARFKSFPGARHSVFADEPAAYDALRLFLDDVQAGNA
jgi:pimeloyl-ACP methyl ester carboxylesterase